MEIFHKYKEKKGGGKGIQKQVVKYSHLCISLNFTQNIDKFSHKT